ncbi:MAG TPA: hypothetical protein VNB49_07020 [Candidatus Dormibacteraeota bacterium]|nr:hypothetical protein [Candidatus Dormibacteraeota bacterium]
MLALYRSLLYLYPSAYRCEYGEEMMEVLSEVQAEIRKRRAFARVWCGAQEAGGLLYGALHENLRRITGSYDHGLFSSLLSPRRFKMKSEFRFPKSTVALMMVILAAVIFAIEKAKAISASLPHANRPVGPIQPTHFAIVPSLLVAMIGAIAAGLIGWGALFALHRSGVQQLSEMKPLAGQRSSETQSAA